MGVVQTGCPYYWEFGALRGQQYTFSPRQPEVQHLWLQRRGLWRCDPVYMSSTRLIARLFVPQHHPLLRMEPSICTDLGNMWAHREPYANTMQKHLSYLSVNTLWAKWICWPGFEVEQHMCVCVCGIWQHTQPDRPMKHQLKGITGSNSDQQVWPRSWILWPLRMKVPSTNKSPAKSCKCAGASSICTNAIQVSMCFLFDVVESEALPRRMITVHFPRLSIGKSPCVRASKTSGDACADAVNRTVQGDSRSSSRACTKCFESSSVQMIKARCDVWQGTSFPKWQMKWVAMANYSTVTPMTQGCSNKRNKYVFTSLHLFREYLGSRQGSTWNWVPTCCVCIAIMTARFETPITCVDPAHCCFLGMNGTRPGIRALSNEGQRK